MAGLREPSYPATVTAQDEDRNPPPVQYPPRPALPVTAGLFSCLGRRPTKSTTAPLILPPVIAVLLASARLLLHLKTTKGPRGLYQEHQHYP
jgi:hypothetical protein